MVNVIEQIIELPLDWHSQGGLDPKTAAAIVGHCEGREIRQSMETGAGKSTLLFSHLSQHHTSFSMDEGESLSTALNSPLLRRKNVTIIEGPSQRTLPQHRFERLQLALIDGPHAYPFPELEYYYIYPHLDPGALLIIDDVDIPTINNMYKTLRADRMYRDLGIVRKTAFLERTDATALDPILGWWREQDYNGRKRIVDRSIWAYSQRTVASLKRNTPPPVRSFLKRALRMNSAGAATRAPAMTGD